MRRNSVAAVAMAGVLFVAGLAAQAKPDFTGKWTLVPDPNAAAQGGGGGGGRGGRGGGQFCGQECTIAQAANTLTVTRTTQAGEQKASYNLDGTDSKNMMPGRGGGAGTEVVSKARWDGAKLTIATTRDFNGTAVTTTTAVTMTGPQMVVENTTDMGQGPQTTKQTYNKQ